jgi:hypothetical protein
MKKHLITLLTSGILLGAVGAQAQVTLASWDFSNATDGNYTIAATAGQTTNLTVSGGATGDFKAVSETISLQKGSKWNGATLTMPIDASSISGSVSLDFDAQWNIQQSNVWGVTTAQISYATDFSEGSGTFTPIGSAIDMSAAGDGVWDSYSLDIGSVLANQTNAAVRFTFSGGLANWAAGAQTNFDNLSITAVPEPSTYALFTGFLVLGGVMLRRRFKG